MKGYFMKLFKTVEKKFMFEIFVHEKDVVTVSRKAYDLASPVFFPSIGWCGWTNADDCWWVRFKTTSNGRNAFLDWLEGTDIELINPALVR